jgi:hypothetical protein
LKEVGVPRLDAKTKSMFLPLVVVMELPPTYADCKVIVLAEHLVTLLDESRHRAVPGVLGLVNPLKTKNELELVLTVTLLLLPGVKIADPEALNACPLGINAPPLKVDNPKTLRVEERVVIPVTPKVPAIAVFPVDASMVNLLVLTLTLPVTPKVELRVVAPVTPNVPPKVVAPLLTLKVFVPVTEVLPFKETLPVPVEKVVPIPP